jgi:O-acetyl-ADP-ribose deacetylase (regulator of RNase III)
MKPITYLVGDATRPQGIRPVIVAHCCNDVGIWGAGFVLALSKRWPEPERYYRSHWNVLGKGGVQLVEVDDGIIVANIVGQHGVGRFNGVPPVRYPWLHKGFETIARHALHLKASVHMPRLGCGLAGGEWAIVESLIIEDLCALDVPVFIYDLPVKWEESA